MSYKDCTLVLSSTFACIAYNADWRPSMNKAYFMSTALLDKQQSKAVK